MAGLGVNTSVHLLLRLAASLVPICSLGLFTNLVSERGSGPRPGQDLKKVSSVGLIPYTPYSVL